MRFQGIRWDFVYAKEAGAIVKCSTGLFFSKIIPVAVTVVLCEGCQPWTFSF